LFPLLYASMCSQIRSIQIPTSSNANDELSVVVLCAGMISVRGDGNVLLIVDVPKTASGLALNASSFMAIPHIVLTQRTCFSATDLVLLTVPPLDFTLNSTL